MDGKLVVMEIEVFLLPGEEREHERK